MFSRILIANRGEIALRIIRACRELGVQTVAVFSQEDADAPYLQLADDAICIGPGPAAESYLNIPSIISAAEIADVQAIHPGYGFLAENAHFAEICRSCKIEFIGPSAQSMSLLGDKVEARKLAKEAQVPLKAMKSCWPSFERTRPLGSLRFWAMIVEVPDARSTRSTSPVPEAERPAAIPGFDDAHQPPERSRPPQSQ